MTEALKRAGSAAELVFSYHARSKHRLDGYAAGPKTLDWTEQPNPFREYDGSARTLLPLHASRIGVAFASRRDAAATPSYRPSLAAVGALLELSLGLSAWRQYGPDRWALRCNPSSGNLHPTEAYLLTRQLPGLDDGLYHYVSRDHALEQRCRLNWIAAQPSDPGLWIGLSSVHWRAAWKYGERAFRYCQLDLGHAVGALRYAAAVLGWQLRLVDPCDGTRLARLLGVDRRSEFVGAERQEPDLLLAVIPRAAPSRARVGPAARSVPSPTQSKWRGVANVLDAHPMHRWALIDEVAAATVQRVRHSVSAAQVGHWPYPPLSPAGTAAAVDVIRHRRSAQQFDRKFTMPAGNFFHLLDSLLTRPALPWDVWDFTARVHPLIFVHRVEALAPGLYALPRRFQADTALRNVLRKDFLWRRVDTAPKHLPLFQLLLGDFRQLAKTLSCHQAIAGDSSFTVAMLADFDQLIVERPWRYRQLYWEAGLLGQVLYLEAEALGLSGTGIGCYFDDALHEVLGLVSECNQSLYHFTVGRALVDSRISTQPPYADRPLLDLGDGTDGT